MKRNFLKHDVEAELWKFLWIYSSAMNKSFERGKMKKM